MINHQFLNACIIVLIIIACCSCNEMDSEELRTEGDAMQSSSEISQSENGYLPDLQEFSTCSNTDSASTDGTSSEICSSADAASASHEGLEDDRQEMFSDQSTDSSSQAASSQDTISGMSDMTIECGTFSLYEGVDGLYTVTDENDIALILSAIDGLVEDPDGEPGDGGKFLLIRVTENDRVIEYYFTTIMVSQKLDTAEKVSWYIPQEGSFATLIEELGFTDQFSIKTK